MNDRAAFKRPEFPQDELLSSLQQLDFLLQRAISAAEGLYGAGAAADPYRGLYVDREEVERAIARQPGVPTFQPEGADVERIGMAPQLLWLERAFALSPFDTNLVLIALAPEIDLRYERVYAYLQDDVTRKRPTVDLALNLLCSSASDKLRRRSHFTSDAPLIEQGILHLLADPNHIHPPLLARYLHLDEQIVRWLLGEEELDGRLQPFSQLEQPAIALEQLPLHSEMRQALLKLVTQAEQGNQPLQLHFYGATGTGKRRTAEAIAGHLHIPLLAADLSIAIALKLDFQSILPLLFREARLQNALLYLTGLDLLLVAEHAVISQLLAIALADDRGLTILASQEQELPFLASSSDRISVNFAPPDFAQRCAHWQLHLDRVEIELDRLQLEDIANRFRLTPDRIENAVNAACSQGKWRTAAQLADVAISTGSVEIGDLFAAARAQSGQALRSLVRKLEPRYLWEDIILPDAQRAQLQEVCDRAKYRYLVYGQWGFERKLSLGKGLNVLFSGPPGTGKTMAAEVMANELQLDLYKIDLSQVVSKYIGETEKNLDRIFNAAQSANAILFFDEADALFGKRSEVKDAHDRYANIEVGYLLQKMEEYEGVAILATNLRQSMDEAFLRRLQIIVEFPFPDEAERQRIWAVIFPEEAPLGEDVEFEVLAKAIKLAGGNIKNIGLSAAFYAAGEGKIIQMRHLIEAARREYQKLGRTWSWTVF
jgi:AAA+ superfamily predicted ATPase